VKSPFPEWVEPMAATLTQERFTGPEWIFERKLDGIRLLAFKQGPDVRLLSRNRLPQNGCYPSLIGAIANLPVHDVILDGEATSGWEKHGRIAYHIFDIMWLDGRDVTSLPLDERRALLSRLPLRAPLGRVARLNDPKPWERACSEGWEGVIAKRRDSVYEHRRSPHWLKMKCEATQELVVGGFTDPQGGRVGLGALLVGYFAPPPSSGRPEQRSNGDDFVFAGKVGTGFNTKLLLELRARLDALEIPTPPFTRTGAYSAPATLRQAQGRPERRRRTRERSGASGPRKRPSRGSGQSPELKALPRIRAHWVRPEIVVQVAFIEWTVHGKLRHSRLLGIRSDKAAREVVRETP
jgi:bifunctional non-homologous end joining protein LigD